MKATWTPVALAAVLLLVAGCGGGSGNHQPSSRGPLVRGATPADDAWLFRPPAAPKRLVLFFHGQGGAREATPYYHRAWIDHLVAGGAAVIYPRYERSYSRAVLAHAIAGIRDASGRLHAPGLPVFAIGYSRGGALVLEYAAAAPAAHVPVPSVVESVNPVPVGEQSRPAGLSGLRHRTALQVIASDRDPGAIEGVRGLLARLKQAGFPAHQIWLQPARSHGSFVADHLAPLGDSAAARAAYWAPTDAFFILRERH